MKKNIQKVVFFIFYCSAMFAMNENIISEKGRVFITGPVKLTDPGYEKIQNYPPHKWLQAEYKSKGGSSSIKINEDSITVFKQDSVISEQIDVTHSGLIQYVFAAWAKELGVVLTPDMIFYTVLSEIRKHIDKSPELFAYLFSNSAKKDQIQLVGSNRIEDFLNELKKRLPNKELYEIISQTKFTTEPTHFFTVKDIIFASMSSNYYEYSMTMCGIPKVKVLGDENDWILLKKAVVTMRDNVFKTDEDSFDHPMVVLKDYLRLVENTLSNIIAATFTSSDDKYFEKMFIYGKDRDACRSGHDYVELNGWLRNFYISGYYYSENLEGSWPNFIKDYPSHFNFLPYINKLSQVTTYHFYASGLCTSKIDNGFLVPEYNIIHAEIIDKEKEYIFKTISNN